MAPGRKATLLVLSVGERAALERIASRPEAGQALATRARIVLACAEPGATNVDVARALNVSRLTVATWRARFAAHRMEGLDDAPRSGAPRKVADAAVERLVALTLETRPEGKTHWSTRDMAKRVGMSQTMVSRIWRAFGMAPHRADPFKPSTDPFFEEVRDVVGLYVAPPERALVLCAAERPKTQTIDGTPPVLPPWPGQPGRHDRGDERSGTRDPLAALDIRTGTVIGASRLLHRATAFRAFLDHVEAVVPSDLDVHVVLDNATMCQVPILRDWLVKRPRWHMHVTPTSASWLDMVESWFALQTRRLLRRGAPADSGALEAAVTAWVARTDADPEPFVWTKDADAILASVERSRQKARNPPR